MIPPDNNRSERALRAVALGRKNFLFAGSKEAGENLAALYTVVATCVANEADLLAYLTDVLTRLDSTPADRIDQILPQIDWLQGAQISLPINAVNVVRPATSMAQQCLSRPLI